MNFIDVVGLTALDLLLLFGILRVERRVLWLVLLLLVLPALLAVGRWASVGAHWAEVGVSVAIAIPLTAVWWLAIGRRLPAPTSDNIKVYGRDKLPTPKPEENAALRTEVSQLREETQRLEAELRRLKGGQNGGKRPEG
jgi:type VI protein secretion system component VasK